MGSDDDLRARQRGRYDAIYGAQSDVWLYPRTAGLHGVILHLVQGVLPDRRVLDVGCGAGRLSLHCARSAREVLGVDFAPEAVELARTGAQLCGVTNVRFEVGETAAADGSFDLILIVGVAEHLTDPVDVLRRLARSLAPGGTMLIACPGFSNLRGWSYQTLGKLFGWPMSLADLRQVTEPEVDGWADSSHLRRVRTVGALYGSVWGEYAVRDMVKRIPAAARDAGHAGPLGLEAYGAWLASEAAATKDLLDIWRGAGWLRDAPTPAPLTPTGFDELAPEVAAKLRSYLSLDDAGDVSWSDVPPVNRMGGEGLYFLTA